MGGSVGAFTVKVFDVFDARIMMDGSPAIVIDFKNHTFHDYPIELIIGGFEPQKTQKVGSIGSHQALEVPDASTHRSADDSINSDRRALRPISLLALFLVGHDSHTAAAAGLNVALIRCFIQSSSSQRDREQPRFFPMIALSVPLLQGRSFNHPHTNRIDAAHD